MDIKDILPPDYVVVDLVAAGKPQLLRELCHRAAEDLALPADLITTGILKREELGSTGMGRGVAIPHARFAEISKPYALLARLRKPVEFEAIDGEPVDIVFLLLLPAATVGDQLNTLATVSRRLRTAGIPESIRRARSDAEVHRVVAGQ